MAWTRTLSKSLEGTTSSVRVCGLNVRDGGGGAGAGEMVDICVDGRRARLRRLKKEDEDDGDNREERKAGVVVVEEKDTLKL